MIAEGRGRGAGRLRRDHRLRPARHHAHPRRPRCTSCRRTWCAATPSAWACRSRARSCAPRMTIRLNTMARGHSGVARRGGRVRRRDAQRRPRPVGAVARLARRLRRPRPVRAPRACDDGRGRAARAGRRARAGRACPAGRGARAPRRSKPKRGSRSSTAPSSWRPSAASPWSTARRCSTPPT